MARNETITLLPGQWTQITNADVTAVRVQSLSALPITMQATAGATQPGSPSGSIVLNSYDIISDRTVADLFPGVTGANRLWARSEIGGQMSVSHA